MSEVVFPEKRTKTAWTVCVGIPTYNRDDVLLQTLYEVFAQTRLPDEVIVFDQNAGHSPEITDELSKLCDQRSIRLLKGTEPSLTAARNKILQASCSDVTIFIDDDTLLPPEFVEQCVTDFEKHAVVCLQCQIHHRRDGFELGTLDRVNPNRGCFPQFPETEFHGRHSLLHGCHAVKREIAISVGGYDEQFVGSAFGEDVEFGMRIQKAGHLIHFDPNFWLIHLRAPTGGCRINEWPQWTESANIWLAITRYGLREGRFFVLVWASLRHGPLLKRNVVQLWRQPFAWVSYVVGMILGIFRGVNPVKSPFIVL